MDAHIILAVREDHRGMRYFTECWHKGCYPDTEMSLARGEDKDQHIIHDAQIGTMGGSRMSVLVKHNNERYGPDYQDLAAFMWQLCVVCKNVILPYRYTAIYTLDSVSKVGAGYDPIRVQDVIARFNKFRPLAMVSALETLVANYNTNTVQIRFHMFELLTTSQTHSLNINGVLPQLDLERL